MQATIRLSLSGSKTSLQCSLLLFPIRVTSILSCVCICVFFSKYLRAKCPFPHPHDVTTPFFSLVIVILLFFQEGQVIECSQISDVRDGFTPKVRTQSYTFHSSVHIFPYGQRHKSDVHTSSTCATFRL